MTDYYIPFLVQQEAPWSFVKTFGPGIITACVTGSIASAAYIVARTQREIAENKYKLDLFDKRLPLYEKYNEMYKELKDADLVSYSFGWKKLISSNKELLGKCSKIFSNLSDDIKILEEINVFHEMTEKLGKLKDKIDQYDEKYFQDRSCIDIDLKKSYDTLMYYKHIPGNEGRSSYYKYSKINENLRKLQENYEEKCKERENCKYEISNLTKEISIFSERISTALVVIKNSMEDQLNISHRAYTKYKNFHIRNIIMGPIRFVCKIRW
ncbi:hypothetical protein [Acetobacter persici]|uniref:hypothetical protein n=1 Tax=Acetobacter persici TaxID=1076596 RepID=UPI001BA80E99|nr:hypothetical protein [Acetobacter persici]MBS1016884.1 hypothetical protein [Acetobacter persici]